MRTLAIPRSRLPQFQGSLTLRWCLVNQQELLGIGEAGDFVAGAAEEEVESAGAGEFVGGEVGDFEIAEAWDAGAGDEIRHSGGVIALGEPSGEHAVQDGVVVAGAAADEDVVADPTYDLVEVAAADHQVASGATDELVIAVAADDDVVAIAAGQGVVAAAAIDGGGQGDGWLHVDDVVAIEAEGFEP